MRGMLVGAVGGGVLAGLIGLWLSDRSTVMAQIEQPAARSHDIIAVPLAGESGRFLAVIAAQSRVMGIYEIHPTSGAIALRSVRNITWDLQLEELNTGAPSPKEIRALLGTKR
ncbi:MAG: hypothetical protein KatS3mg110_3256 [Pirellulaceae bacterium]|nr:MAG: hypothetical protein KatS3mg110_3256 [Pirellulaceae bacterium]